LRETSSFFGKGYLAADIGVRATWQIPRDL
jgi:hypothetical protein